MILYTTIRIKTKFTDLDDAVLFSEDEKEDDEDDKILRILVRSALHRAQAAVQEHSDLSQLEQQNCNNNNNSCRPTNTTNDISSSNIPIHFSTNHFTFFTTSFSNYLIFSRNESRQGIIVFNSFNVILHLLKYFCLQFRV